MSKLTQDSTDALEAGMSYGYWKVLHPVTFLREVPKKPKKRKQKKVEAQYRRVCARCGKEFFITRNILKKYCCEECAQAENGRRARERYHARDKAV